MKKYIYLLFYCFVCSLPLFAQENGTPRKQAISQKDIFISFDCVKHLVFPVQVSDIAIGEQELVMASRVEEAPHIVRLSAQAEGFTEETNLTVVCIDGSVYTYHIRSQRPPSGRVLLSGGHRLRNARQRGVLHSGRLQQPVESINRQRCRGIFQPVCGG